MYEEMNETTKNNCGEFDHQYFDSQRYFDNEAQEQYLRHNVNVYNQINHNGVVFDAMYQTGNSFRNNDYSLPSEELELSYTDSTDKVLIEVSQLNACDLESDSSVQNIIEYLQCDSIRHKDDLVTMFNLVQQNLVAAKAYFDSLEFNIVISNAFNEGGESAEEFV